MTSLSNLISPIL